MSDFNDGYNRHATPEKKDREVGSFSSFSLLFLRLPQQMRGETGRRGNMSRQETVDRATREEEAAYFPADLFVSVKLALHVLNVRYDVEWWERAWGGSLRKGEKKRKAG